MKVEGHMCMLAEEENPWDEARCNVLFGAFEISRTYVPNDLMLERSNLNN